MTTKTNPLGGAGLLERDGNGQVIVYGLDGKPVRLKTPGGGGPVPGRPPSPQTMNLRDRLPGLNPETDQGPILPGTGPFLQSSAEARPSLGAAVSGDIAYLAQNANGPELHSLREKVEKRIAALPEWKYYRCPSCGWRAKFRVRSYGPPYRLEPDRGPVLCLKCHSAGSQSLTYDAASDKGVMKEMSAKDGAKWEAEIAAATKLEVDRSRRARFFEVNQRRQAAGLAPFTEAEFREEERREFLRATGRGMF